MLRIKGGRAPSSDVVAYRVAQWFIAQKAGPALPILPFLSPDLFHHWSGNIPRRLRPRDRGPFFQRQCENASGGQSLFLSGAIFEAAGHDARDRLVYGSHDSSIADLLREALIRVREKVLTTGVTGGHRGTLRLNQRFLGSSSSRIARGFRADYT